MTDKGEVIVNKINLKECEYFKGVGCICDSFRFWGCTKLGGMCSEHPDCYFKQLKRKEQESDKYKEALDEIEELISEEVILWDEVDRMTAQILEIINKVREQ